MFDRPMTRERTFILRVGKEGNDFGREIKVKARSSLEAGMRVTTERLIPDGYIAQSLVDPVAERAKLRG